jgi:HAD superfamily hydrolase (TIGR01509 family)
MYRAVVLGFDGVVTDSTGFREEAYIRLFSGLGIRISATRLRSFRGLTTRELIERVADGCAGGRKSGLDDMCRRFYYELYRAYEKGSRPSPRLKDFLDYCEGRGWKVGIASGTPSNVIRMVLKRFRLSARFAEIVGGEEVSSDKPDPEMLEKVLGKMGEHPEDSIAVDSSRQGIIAAKLIGMYAIAYIRYSKARIREADLSVQDFSDIIGL